MRLTFLLIGLAGLLMACGSGLTAFKNGRYDSAVTQAAQRLSRKSTHQKAQTILVAAYENAYNQHQDAIRRLSRSPDPFRWEKVLPEYEQLQQLHDRLADCSVCQDLLKTYPTDYQDGIREVRELAASDRYKAAEQAFTYRETDRLAARDAVLNFQKASEWVKNYRDAEGRAADALYFAALRVVIEPLTNRGHLSASEYNQLQRTIGGVVDRQKPPSQFVRFYMPGVTPEPGRQPDQLIQTVVTDYDDYREAVSSSSETVVSTQEYKVGTKKINDSTEVDVYEKVKGTLTTYQKTVTASLSGRLRAIDLGNENILWEDGLWATESWSDKWFSFSGDDRALNGQSLKTSCGIAPSAWQLYDNLASSLASSVGYKLRQRYRDY